jgi:hypothetical protein
MPPDRDLRGDWNGADIGDQKRKPSQISVGPLAKHVHEQRMISPHSRRV